MSGEATANEIQDVRQDLENTLAPVFAKFAEPGQLTACVLFTDNADRFSNIKLTSSL